MLNGEQREKLEDQGDQLDQLEDQLGDQLEDQLEDQ